MSVVIVTGTGTEVGKTVVTAAVAACAAGRVAVVKPVQTGVGPGDAGDLAEVTRLTGITDVHEFRRYPAPMSPHHAAMLSGLEELYLDEAVERIDELSRERDLVVVEGAGGLLVPYDRESRWTMADLALEIEAELIVVVEPGLGTINHTALVASLLEQSATVPEIVIGSWPPQPDLTMRCNVTDLAHYARNRTLAGVLPAGIPTMGDFVSRARTALSPRWGGTFDWPAFRAAVAP